MYICMYVCKIRIYLIYQSLLCNTSISTIYYEVVLSYYEMCTMYTREAISYKVYFILNRKRRFEATSFEKAIEKYVLILQQERPTTGLPNRSSYKSIYLSSVYIDWCIAGNMEFNRHTLQKGITYVCIQAYISIDHEMYILYVRKMALLCSYIHMYLLILENLRNFTVE